MLPESRTGASQTKPSRVRVYGGAVQAIPNGVLTTVNLNTEDFDALSEFDAAGTHGFTPQRAGYYLASIQARWLVPPAVTAAFEAYFMNLAGLAQIGSYRILTTTDYCQIATGVAYITPADTYFLRVRHNGGAGITLQSGRPNTILHIHRLS